MRLVSYIHSFTENLSKWEFLIWWFPSLGCVETINSQKWKAVIKLGFLFFFFTSCPQFCFKVGSYTNLLNKYYKEAVYGCNLKLILDEVWSSRRSRWCFILKKYYYIMVIYTILPLVVQVGLLGISPHFIPVTINPWVGFKQYWLAWSSSEFRVCMETLIGSS